VTDEQSERIIAALERIAAALEQRAKGPDQSELLGQELELSGFTPRVRKTFWRLSIQTVQDLTGTTASQLGACKGFGQTSLQEVQMWLAKRGLRLKGD
jgi:DNA-directed RNA polymerase alpha subunit